jgi:plastocyanin
MTMYPTKLKRNAVVTMISMALLASTVVVTQAQEVTHVLTIRDGKFEPSSLEVKADTKFKLTITNATAKAAEFESSELNREKVVPAGKSATVIIGPLKAGTYPFVDDFNKANKGEIVAK